MLAIRPNGSICARCAIRNHILVLRQSRSRSSSTRQKNDKSSKVRFRAFDDTESSRRQGPRGAFGTGPGGTLRKHYGKTGPADWGLDDVAIEKRKAAQFREALRDKLKSIKEEVKDAPVLEQLAKDSREMGDKEQGFSKLWNDFTQKICELDAPKGWGLNPANGQGESLWEDLRSAFQTRGLSGLEDRIKYAFYAHVTGSRFTESDVRNQQALADLRYPTEWYPATRTLHRTIHLHVGPTNSGKTYQALQRLEQAESGVYAGPLRLLAHEVYSRMNAKGKPCALITGEERRSAEQKERGEGEDAEEQSELAACTVEMVPLNKTMDVAVIDEIQMIGNSERGWAWTQALLGVKAKEVHLCGEERTVPLIQELCASLGEKLEIHRYERLSPLQMSDRSLDGDLRRLRKGDCLVSFSVMGIHALRREIEKVTGRKVATVYGSLPPETRAQQARLFNDPNNDFDFLVASDAVGMGLNLAIKRIIFESSSKFDGMSRRALPIADIKQIAGRAGRFRTALQATEAPASQQNLAAAKGEIAAEEAVANQDKKERELPDNLGLITTLERFDFPIVRAAMGADPEPIKTAGLFPPASVLERFAGYFPPGTPFSYIITRLHELSSTQKRFHLCGLKDQVWIADIVEPVQGLTIADRNLICSVPCSKADNDLWKKLMPALARRIAEQSDGNLANIEEMPLEVLDMEVSASRDYLRALERLHKGIVAYLWLSYRFAGIFNTRALAFHAKQMVEQRIADVLEMFSFTEAKRRDAVKRREQQILEDLLIGERNRAEQEAAEKAQGNEGEVDRDGEEVEAEKHMADMAGEDVSWERSDEDEEYEHGQESEGKETEDLSQPHKEDEKYQLGQELEGKEAQPDLLQNLDDQTSLTAGGDHLSGDQDIPLEEPEVEELRSRANMPEEDQTQDAVPRPKEEKTLFLNSQQAPGIIDTLLGSKEENARPSQPPDNSNMDHRSASDHSAGKEHQSWPSAEAVEEFSGRAAEDYQSKKSNEAASAGS
ncbi:hypothetical protein DOTSEDRAFT_91028 [Lecanosticta acicola]|uniref:RNA helicase n=1 Tax=Lecanosticta acicola TaxID=111012 RepID=A0AAI8YU85_9PEZI|nr:hypothetical protein DOTSEDRAFT_91028 [Lecanosticta acicola]